VKLAPGQRDRAATADRATQERGAGAPDQGWTERYRGRRGVDRHARGAKAAVHEDLDDQPAEASYLTFDRPSDQFGSFGDAEVSAVGIELDHKLAALLEHLGVSVPHELRTT
jgi:hypothetical protein